MSNSSGSGKIESSRFADAVTINSRPPAGISTPPTSVSTTAWRRHATTEPLYRKHSSTAFGISVGSAQSSSHAALFSSNVRNALPDALVVVS